MLFNIRRHARVGNRVDDLVHEFQEQLLETGFSPAFFDTSAQELQQLRLQGHRPTENAKDDCLHL